MASIEKQLTNLSTDHSITASSKPSIGTPDVFSFDVDGFDLCEVVNTDRAALSAQPGLLVASEGKLRGVRVVVVDVDVPCLDLLSHPVSPGQVPEEKKHQISADIWFRYNCTLIVF